MASAITVSRGQPINNWKPDLVYFESTDFRFGRRYLPQIESVNRAEHSKTSEQEFGYGKMRLEFQSKAKLNADTSSN